MILIVFLRKCKLYAAYLKCSFHHSRTHAFVPITSVICSGHFDGKALHSADDIPFFRSFICAYNISYLSQGFCLFVFYHFYTHMFTSNL